MNTFNICFLSRVLLEYILPTISKRIKVFLLQSLTLKDRGRGGVAKTSFFPFYSVSLKRDSVKWHQKMTSYNKVVQWGASIHCNWPMVKFILASYWLFYRMASFFGATLRCLYPRIFYINLWHSLCSLLNSYRLRVSGT